VVADLPRSIPGCDEVYVLVVDDGSTDSTVQTARDLGVDYILKNPGNLGLARTFARGLEACLCLGADIIINTDADNQYKGEDIPRLVAPILGGDLDMVVGCRDIANHREFSFVKKLLQRLGSSVVSRLSRTRIPDTTSGFRAFSRRAAMRLCVMNMFSYTLETLIQAGQAGVRVGWIRAGVNPASRPSRLFRSNLDFVANQFATIVNTYLFYYPRRFFGWLAAGSAALALVAMARVAYYLAWVPEEEIKFKVGTGLAALLLLILTVVFAVSGLLGSVMSGLRFLTEDVRFRIRSEQSTGTALLLLEHDLETADTFFAWQHGPGDPGNPKGTAGSGKP
jgi:glycosyltransferase involved in cell wall biosynthesis